MGQGRRGRGGQRGRRTGLTRSPDAHRVPERGLEPLLRREVGIPDVVVHPGIDGRRLTRCHAVRERGVRQRHHLGMHQRRVPGHPGHGQLVVLEGHPVAYRPHVLRCTRYLWDVRSGHRAGDLVPHGRLRHREREREVGALLGHRGRFGEPVLDLQPGRVPGQHQGHSDPSDPIGGELVRQAFPQGFAGPFQHHRGPGQRATAEQLQLLGYRGLVRLVVVPAGRGVRVVHIPVEADHRVLVDQLPPGRLVQDRGHHALGQVDLDPQVFVLQHLRVLDRGIDHAAWAAGTAGEFGDQVHLGGRAGLVGGARKLTWWPDHLQPDQANRWQLGNVHVQEPSGVPMRVVHLGDRGAGQQFAGTPVPDHQRLVQPDPALPYEQPDCAGTGEATGVHRVEGGLGVGHLRQVRAESGGGVIHEDLGIVVRCQRPVVLPVPLLVSGGVAVVAVHPGVGGAPGVLVEQRDRGVHPIGVGGFVREPTPAQRPPHSADGLSVGDQCLGSAGHGLRSRAATHALDPPVAPVAGEGGNVGSDSFLRLGEEVRVGGQPQLREGPGLVPLLHDVGVDQTRWRVVPEVALYAQVQHIPRIWFAVGHRGPVPAEHTRWERVRVVRGRREVGRQQVVHHVVGRGEPEHRPFHVRQAVRTVGHPHQHAVSGRRLPAEQPGQVLTTDQVRNRSAGPVVRDREVAHPGSRQRVRQTGHGARYVGLHRGGHRDAVPFTHLAGQSEQLVQFVRGTGVGVQVVRHRGQLDRAVRDPTDEFRDLLGGPRLGPLLERPQ